MSTPRRYQFDNHRLDPAEPPHLPVQRAEQLPAERYEGPQVVHQHIHQAPPDRVVQRVALGTGIGAGATAGAVYFGPLLVAALTSMAISLAAVSLVIVVTGWAVVSVVRAVGGPEGKAAAKTIRKRS